MSSKAQSMKLDRQRISSGGPWEARVGYSRAIRTGPFVSVAGTTATHPDGRVEGPGDAFAQTRFAMDVIAKALEEAGASLSDVVRTRMFLVDMGDSEAVGRAHAEVFSEIRPAATMLAVRALVSPEHLVEIEVDAIIGERG